MAVHTHCCRAQPLRQLGFLVSVNDILLQEAYYLPFPYVDTYLLHTCFVVLC